VEHDELTTLVYQHIQTSKQETMAQTMAEYLVEQGERRGERLGTLRAKREYTLQVLQSRFDSVPESVIRKIRSIRSFSRLDAIFEKAITATTLDEIEP
jgi:ElaB/YqjD/DUF883 family membrane-anchored ribosome-binding protein